MAFIVQDPDDPTSDANAYISVQFFKDYHDERGNVYSASDTEIEQAIVRGTDYMDSRWTFAGSRLDVDQSTEVPRSGVYDPTLGWIEGFPSEFEEACAEYSLSALDGSLYTSPNIDASGRQVKRTRRKADVIEKETEYFQAGHSSITWKSYPVADGKMKKSGLLTSTRRTLGRG